MSDHTLVVKVWRMLKKLKTKFVVLSRHYAVMMLIVKHNSQNGKLRVQNGILSEPTWVILK